MVCRIPHALYEEVLELATLIAQPDTRQFGTVDEEVASNAMDRLLAIYKQLEGSGTPDPFLTELVADFTDDAEESIRLYELALEQSVAFPDEPSATKHIALARVLLEVGQTPEAHEHLLAARRAASVERDASVLQELDTLEKGLGVDRREVR